MVSKNDENLVRQYFKGDEESLEILIRRYLKPIYGFIYRYIGNTQDTEDITQEVFIKIWRNLKKPTPYRIYLSRTQLAVVWGSGAGFDPKKGSFKTWIFTIAKNTSIDFLKKSRSASGGKKAIPFSRFDNEDGKNIIAETLADPLPLSSELLERQDLADILSAAIEKLSLKYRLVLFLRYNDHLAFREISEVLEESIHTIKSRHRRALIALRKILQS